MSFLKEIKLGGILTAVLCIVIGVLLVIWPGLIMNILCWVLGAVVLVSGILKIVEYVRGNHSGFNSDFVLGVLYAVIGVVLLSHAQFVLSLINLFIGIFVLIDGVTKLQSAIEIKKNANNGWQFLLATAIVTCCLGLLLIFNVFGAGELLSVMMGITLIVVGIQDLCAGAVIHKYLKLLSTDVITVEADEGNTDDN